MDNVWTLMIFGQGQPQAMALQYKSAEKAKQMRDLSSNGSLDKVTLTDDYGRELTLRPVEVQMALLQDVDQATIGNAMSAVKNNIAQALAQVQTQGEVDKDPAIRAAMTRAQLQQGANGGVFRQ